MPSAWNSKTYIFHVKKFRSPALETSLCEVKEDTRQWNAISIHSVTWMLCILEDERVKYLDQYIVLLSYIQLSPLCVLAIHFRLWLNFFALIAHLDPR